MLRAWKSIIFSPNAINFGSIEKKPNLEVFKKSNNLDFMEVTSLKRPPSWRRGKIITALDDRYVTPGYISQLVRGSMENIETELTHFYNSWDK